jgi:serine/threonine protein phosphatase PrpC
LQRKPPFQTQNLHEISHREYRVLISDEDVSRRLREQLEAAASHVDQGCNTDFLLCSIRQERLRRGLPIRVHDVTIEHSLSLSDIGLALCQGRRSVMEDRHIMESFAITVGGQERQLHLQGLFDGHGGAACANYAANNIVKHLQERLQFNRPARLDDQFIFNALKLAMVDLNWEFDLSSVAPNEQRTGTTVNVSLIIEHHIWTINVGDSRAILVDRNNSTCVPLSEDASPINPKYQASIENRGGRVSNYRVEGQLGVARALGNFSLEGRVSARPKLTKYPLPSSPADWYLLHVCDGLTDVASSSQLAGALLQSMDEGKSTEHAAVELVASAFRAGSRDNLSAMVVPIARFL